jgi:endonuclease/exonuclease/phosphatase (EEP) superfamily protein YafD
LGVRKTCKRKKAIGKEASRIGSLVCGLTVIGATTTFITLFARHWWVADLLANLRVQQILSLLTLLMVSLLVHRWCCTFALLVSMAIHLPFFASVFSSPNDAGTRSGEGGMNRLMVANVLTSNPNFDAVVTQIRNSNPDVLAVLELSTRLANRLEQEFAIDYPHRVTRPMDRGNFGIGVYSRHPLDQVNVFTLNDSIESISAIVKSDELKYRIVATHPFPPIGKSGFEKRNSHLFDLADRVIAFRRDQPKLPVVVMGDLNLTPWSPIFGAFATRSLLTRGANRFDLTPTWYAKNHFIFGLVLDHVLLSEELCCYSKEVGDDIGSDHRAVTTQIGRATAARSP